MTRAVRWVFMVSVLGSVGVTIGAVLDAAGAPWWYSLSMCAIAGCVIRIPWPRRWSP